MRYDGRMATPVAAHPRQMKCPIHGEHDKWLFNLFSYGREVGLSQSFSLCGFCAADALRDMGIMQADPAPKKRTKKMLKASEALSVIPKTGD